MPREAERFAPALLDASALPALLSALRDEGYELVGPIVRDGAVVHAPITGVEDLPAGWTASQEPGTYRLERGPGPELFGFAAAAQSWKPFFFTPRQRLFTARRTADGLVFEPELAPAPRLALIGARACDLRALAIQDQIFLDGPYADADYAARRRDTFVVAVNCARAGGTCFCVSMDAGPRATSGFDVALTEITEGPHRFVAEAGSDRGRALLDRLACPPAPPDDVRRADAIVEATAAQMGRHLDTAGIKDLLYRNAEHPRWDDVAGRCLACTNCTLVCPTCFCADVEDSSDLSGETAERSRRWDSCFTLGHSYLPSGSVRQSTRARYRQWLTHKLAGWIDQFGSSGCVGCGRCITWCPVGIDITAEVAAIRATDGAEGPA